MTIVALDIDVGSPKSAREAAAAKDKYGESTITDIVRERYLWLLVFFGGLMLAALIVEEFETILANHVELSYFVPLLIGHGGNTGAQSNATIIRRVQLGLLQLRAARPHPTRRRPLRLLQIFFLLPVPTAGPWRWATCVHPTT